MVNFNRYRLIFMAILIFNLLCTSCVISINQDSNRNADPEPGHRAPDFVLRSLKGSNVRVQNLRGHPILVNFWATWCGPCRSEMPDIQEVHRRYRSEGLVVLAVTSEVSSAEVRDFADKLDIDFPILLDSSGKVAEAYGVQGLPTSFFIDSEGIIQEVYLGSMSRSVIEDNLSTILSN
jgi:peroxiredoxin